MWLLCRFRIWKQRQLTVSPAFRDARRPCYAAPANRRRRLAGSQDGCRSTGFTRTPSAAQPIQTCCCSYEISSSPPRRGKIVPRKYCLCWGFNFSVKDLIWDSGEVCIVDILFQLIINNLKETNFLLALNIGYKLQKYLSIFLDKLIDGTCIILIYLYYVYLVGI